MATEVAVPHSLGERDELFACCNIIACTTALSLFR